MSAAASDENILRRVGVGRPRGVVLGNELQLMQPTSRLRPHESPRPRSVPVMGNAAKLKFRFDIDIDKLGEMPDLRITLIRRGFGLFSAPK